MAKKIRFPLEMDDGIEVRDLDSLRENFSLPRVLEYLKNGKLLTWLKDRYANELAEAIEAIDENDPNIAKRICEVFDIEYNDELQEDLEKSAERAERIERLKGFTDNPDYIKHIDLVAFDQDEMYDLLDEDQETVYLCGSRFSIPISKENMTYIGINNPVAVIDSKVEVDWLEKGIVLKNVTFDDKYQKVLDSAEETKQELYTRLVENVKGGTKENRRNPFSRYKENSYLNFMLPPAERNSVQETFSKLSSFMGDIRYDVDADIIDVKNKLMEFNVVGIAKKYIERL